jgi:lipopolysaccharide/colanic/teichoic acid biosynthesis glycosyltransferase
MTVFTPTSQRIATRKVGTRFRAPRLTSVPVDVTELDMLARRLAAESGPRRQAYNLAKRVLDVTIALGLLIALSWLLLIIALAIVLDSGAPVLFSQARVGRRGQPFNMLKFRTMREERRRHASGPPPGIGERRRRHKSAIDPRVTRAGRLLRRTCLDELPQLWNVVCGEMSLVGPRPELPEIVMLYEPWQHARHLVSPGITGWWQINRDARRLMHQATELDLHYVCHRSLWLDVLILLRTADAVVRGRGAF